MLKINNVIRIPTSIKDNFFLYWLLILKPIHNLSERVMEVAALFLKKRFELQKSVQDEQLLDSIVLSAETKHLIRIDSKMSPQHFQNTINKLKSAKFIIDNKINPKFIPKNLSNGDQSFQLLYYFDLSETGV